MDLKFLDKLGKYYTSCGGIGDLLICLSTFKQKSSIIFWAGNNAAFANQFLEQFPQLIDKKVVFSGTPIVEPELFKAICSHENCLGTGHIPVDLNFVKNWYENPDYYLSEIQKPFLALKKFGSVDEKAIGLSVFASQSESWKERNLNKEQTERIIGYIKNRWPGRKVCLSGSKDDRTDADLTGVTDHRGVELNELFQRLNGLECMVSVDTWFKTWTGLCEIPTCTIKNRYVRTPMQMMGVEIDPSDNIFLAPLFNFEFLDIDKI